MAKQNCFLSFHYDLDNWRVQQVKNMGAIDEQPLLSANQWEEIKRGGDAAIRKWIDDNMKGKHCLVVLAGAKTAGRRWVNYEIKTAWEKRMGVIAVHIHNLKDANGNQSNKGADPFASVTVNGTKVAGHVYDPPFTASTSVYNHIATNIESWVKAAVAAR
jgi:hypothetical protein